MSISFWIEFCVLFAAALFGSLAIMPYSLRLLKGSGKPLKMSISKLLLLSFVQNAVLFVLVISLGLLAARATGLGAPYVEALLAGTSKSQTLTLMLAVAVAFGLVAGIFLLLADLLFLPYWPEPLVLTARKTTAWENLSASFYGGINEELLMRLFGLSVLAYFLSFIWHTSNGLPTAGVFWTVNIIMAIIFGIGHLPALKNLVGEISRPMLARTLLLNAPIGLLCGWLYWTYGIEAAIIAHFSADIVYHVFGTFVLQRQLKMKYIV